MPPVAAILPIILGAVSAGEGLHSLLSHPHAPKPAAPNPQQVSADALKTRNTQEAALSQTFPGIQAATGGSLSPDAWIEMAKLLSNQAGNPGVGAAGQDLLMKLLGQGGAGGGFNVTAGNATNPSSSGPGLTPAGSSFG